jgi:shikimate kinase
MKRLPISFLLGPPGAGKTTLGSRVCKELGLSFLDLAEADLKWLLRVTKVIVDAMARHLAHLRVTGTSPGC